MSGPCMNKDIFGTSDLLSNYNPNTNRGSKDGQIAESVKLMRGETNALKICKMVSSTPSVGSVSELDGAQLLNFKNIDQLIKCGERLASCAHSIDFNRTSNRIVPQVSIISNIDNGVAAVPTSSMKEYIVNITLWTSDVLKLSGMRRKMQLTDDYDEESPYSSKANLSGYSDYPESGEMAKVLKFDKKEYASMGNGPQSVIDKKLSASRGNQSRFVRLVISMIIFISIRMRDEDEVDIDCVIRNIDKVSEYLPINLFHACSKSDTAYVHCNRSDSPEYINYLLMIAREFPIINPDGSVSFLERKGKDGVSNEAFIAGSISIPEEAPRIHVMCDSDPAKMVKGMNLTYTASSWYSYTVNYARSIQLEDRLDAAMGVACLLCFHNMLPNIELPARKSHGELFTRCLATKTQEKVIPNNFAIKEALLGAFSMGSAIVCVGKDIISNHKVAVGASVNDRGIFGYLSSSRAMRHRLYKYMNSHGVGNAMYLARRLDVFNIKRGTFGYNYMNGINPIPYWSISPLLYTHSIKYGFTELARSFHFDTGVRLNSMMRDDLSKTTSVFRVLGVCNGNLSKARSKPKRLVINRKAMANLETDLMSGRSCILKSGIRVLNRKLKIADRRGCVMVNPPPENFGDPDEEDDYSDSYDSDDISYSSDRGVNHPSCYPVYSDDDSPSSNKGFRLTEYIQPIKKYPLRGASKSGSKSISDIESNSKSSFTSRDSVKRIVKTAEEMSQFRDKMRSSSKRDLDVSSVPPAISTGEVLRDDSRRPFAEDDPISYDSDADVSLKLPFELDGNSSNVVKCDSLATGTQKWKLKDGSVVNPSDRIVGKKLDGETVDETVTIDSVGVLQADDCSDSSELSDTWSDDDPDVVGDTEDDKASKLVTGGISEQEVSFVLTDYIAKHEGMDRVICSDMVTSFVDKHRLKVVSDALVLVSTQARASIFDSFNDRVGAQRACLSNVKNMVLKSAASDSADAISKTFISGTTRSRKLSKRTKVFRRHISDFGNLKMPKPFKSEMLTIAYNQYLTKMHITRSECEVDVSETLLKGCNLKDDTICRACSGVLIEYLQDAKYDHPWWVSMGRSIGIDPKFCRSALNTVAVKRIISMQMLHPGFINRRIKVSDSAIFAYADFISYFMTNKVVKFKMGTVNVVADLDTAEPDVLRAWFRYTNTNSSVSGIRSDDMKRFQDEILTLLRMFSNMRYTGKHMEHE